MDDREMVRPEPPAPPCRRASTATATATATHCSTASSGSNTSVSAAAHHRRAVGPARSTSPASTPRGTSSPPRPPPRGGASPPPQGTGSPPLFLGRDTSPSGSAVTEPWTSSMRSTAKSRSPKEEMEAATMAWTAAAAGIAVVYWFVWVMGAAEVKGKSAVDLNMGSITNEERVADLLEAHPGHHLLDVGCGVGGPMRAIAAHSGADVVSITINEYEVNRARTHNRKAGLDACCEVVRGNFLAMSFPDASFDGAYSIEATCHAPGL